MLVIKITLYKTLILEVATGSWLHKTGHFGGRSYGKKRLDSGTGGWMDGWMDGMLVILVITSLLKNSLSQKSNINYKISLSLCGKALTK
jgi:hypothetical protein